MRALRHARCPSRVAGRRSCCQGACLGASHAERATAARSPRVASRTCLLRHPCPPRRFTDVYPLNAGLWGRAANITLALKDSSGPGGEWGKVFREAQANETEGAIPAYSVGDIAAMFDVPAFDFVKIDIEGTVVAAALPTQEGRVVLAPGSAAARPPLPPALTASACLPARLLPLREQAPKGWCLLRGPTSAGRTGHESSRSKCT